MTCKFAISFDYEGSEVQVQNLTSYLHEFLRTFAGNVHVQASLGQAVEVEESEDAE